MGFSEAASAIDDSSPSIHLHGNISGPRDRGQPLTAEEYVFGGPRSGHWTIRASNMASAVDDGGTVVHELFPSRHAAPASGRHRHEIDKRELREDGGAARQTDPRGKSGRRNKTQLLELKEEVKPAEDRKKHAEAAKHRTAADVPKGPRRGIRIKRRDGATEILKDRVSTQASSKQPEPQNTIVLDAQQASSHESSSASTDKPGSASSRLNSKIKRVRIANRSGERVLAGVPASFMDAKIGPAFSSSSENRETEREKQAQKMEREYKVRQKLAAKAAEKLRQEREEAKMQSRRQRDRDAEVGAQAIMSGALAGSSIAETRFRPTQSREKRRSPAVRPQRAPLPSPEFVRSKSRTTVVEPQSEMKHSPRRSGKDSAVAFQGDAWEADSQADAWKADSKVATSTPSEPTGQRPPKHYSRGSGTPERQQERPWKTGWIEVGEGHVPSMAWGASPLDSQQGAKSQSNALRTPPRAASQDIKGPGPKDSSRARPLPQSPAWEKTWANMQSDAASSAARSHHRHGSVQSFSKLRVSNQTIHAGTGWISPHPLSCVATELETPPQEKIWIAMPGEADSGTEMTYGQWKAMRDQQNTVSSVVSDNRDEVCTQRSTEYWERSAGGSNGGMAMGGGSSAGGSRRSGRSGWSPSFGEHYVAPFSSVSGNLRQTGRSKNSDERRNWIDEAARPYAARVESWHSMSSEVAYQHSPPSSRTSPRSSSRLGSAKKRESAAVNQWGFDEFPRPKVAFVTGNDGKQVQPDPGRAGGEFQRHFRTNGDSNSGSPRRGHSKTQLRMPWDRRSPRQHSSDKLSWGD